MAQTHTLRGSTSAISWLHSAKLIAVSCGAYDADTLIFSDDFEWEDEAVAEALFFLSDESAPLTITEVEEARSRLATAE